MKRPGTKQGAKTCTFFGQRAARPLKAEVPLMSITLAQNILAALDRVGAEAHAPPIHDALSRDGVKLSYGALHAALDVLEHQGLVTSRPDRAAAQTFWSLTPQGREALYEASAFLEKEPEPAEKRAPC